MSQETALTPTSVAPLSVRLMKFRSANLTLLRSLGWNPDATALSDYTYFLDALLLDLVPLEQGSAIYGGGK